MRDFDSGEIMALEKLLFVEEHLVFFSPVGVKGDPSLLDTFASVPSRGLSANGRFSSSTVSRKALSTAMTWVKMNSLGLLLLSRDVQMTPS